MTQRFALFALVLAFAFGGAAFAPVAHADGKAAIKPPVVIAPTPLQEGTLRGSPQPANCCPTPAPVQPRIISRNVSEPEPRGLRLDDSFVVSMNGGVGTGVSDVALGGGAFGTGFGGNDFGRSQRVRFARQAGRFNRGRRSGRRGFRGGRSGGRR